MAMMRSISLKDFVHNIDREDTYPFYCVLLYTPKNGLDERMHKYVNSRWTYLNSLTGTSCLMFAIEDIDRGISIEKFKPEEVYDIARLLGVSVQSLPCVVFFTEPKKRNETLILKLHDFFPEPKTVTDDEVTSFFRAVQSVIDTCTAGNAESRLQCLREGFEKQWPKGSQWANMVAKLPSMGGWLVASVTTGATVVTALSTILNTIAPFLK